MNQEQESAMSIITSHDITLYGSMGPHAITLCPLTDQHLPYL